jgi:heterotetrameric sarcosine oxidase gamma subunit
VAEALGFAPMMGGGITVRADERSQAAALRYFDARGEFAAAVREALGVTPPEVQRAVETPAGQLLAWRSPTETLLLAQSASHLSQIEVQLARAAGGCLVNLSGGLRVLRVTGEHIEELLCRLGGSDCVPAVGEARRGRLADVPVLLVSLRLGEALLVVERVYAEHLAGWIRETLFDFAAAAGGADSGATAP